MAVQSFSYYLILLFLKNVKNYSIHVQLPDFHETDFNERSHFRYTAVIKACNNRDSACSSNDSDVCAIRVRTDKKEYKDFKNICYLFMSNMCDYPGEEFAAIQGGSCEKYQTSRRTEDIASEISTQDEPYNSNEAHTESLRSHKKVITTLSTLYEIDTAYDYHACPYSCPNVYSPVCVNVNRGFGKYFKMLNFVNHCEADVYYCKHWREFSPPPDEDENVRSSPLSWSFCGASRYLQFARFAEVTSSLGHYGWLAGDHKFSHIMEPHERLPGYG